MNGQHEGWTTPRGLPGSLPDGEHLLWQGAPDWRTLARGALHVRKIMIYFGFLLAWFMVSSLSDGRPVATVAVGTLRFAGLALVPILLLTGYAWLTSRTTVYTVTSRRVVIRFGLALPMTINIPLRFVESANLKVNANGIGDIALQLSSSEGIAYLVLWPHARPWRMARAEPMLRAVTDANVVAQTLVRALASSAPIPVTVLTQARSVRSSPAGAGHRVAA